MMEESIECLSLAFDNIQAMRYNDSKSIDDIVNFVGKDNISMVTGFTDNTSMETRLIISENSSYNGFSEMVKLGDWILKIAGYIDTKTNEFRSKYMVMSDIMVRTLFIK